MKIKHVLLVALFGATLSLAQAVTLPGPVVSSEWLANNKSEVQIVEVASNIDSFMSQPASDNPRTPDQRIVVDFGGHIEGSSLMDFSKVRVERLIKGKKVKYLIPEQANFEKIAQLAGINSNKPIVLVPFGLESGDLDEALRILWQFKVYGEKNIAILDGGLTGWLSEGRDVTALNARKKKGNWIVQGYRKDLVATSDEVAQASRTSKTQLIDARSREQYIGQTKLDFVNGYGHIKGAKNFSPELMTRSTNGALYFLNKTTYEASLSQNGIEPSLPSISYCNTGRYAAGPWFIVSEIIGNPSVKLYDGSLNLWTIEDRPLVSTGL